MKKIIFIFMMIIMSLSVFAKVSWYSKGFEGKLTASGYVYDSSKYVCASNEHPFGTVLKVTNKENNKSVVVIVVDRGSFTKKYGRQLDLSRAAFAKIAKLGKGLINADIKVISSENTFRYKHGGIKFTDKEYDRYTMNLI